MGMNKAVLKYIAVAAVAGGIGLAGGYYGFSYAGYHSQEDVSEQFKSVSVDSVNIPVQGSPVIGAAQPKVTIVIYVDFNSKGAKVMHEKVLDDIFRTHENEIAVVHKAYPIKQSPQSELRSQAAVAAHLQNRYWDMADELFKYAEKPFDKNIAIEIAKKLNLDIARFEKDMESSEVRARIRADIDIAYKNGVDRSPYIFVNGKDISKGATLSTDKVKGFVNAESQRIRKLSEDPGFYYFAASEWNAVADQKMKVLGKSNENNADHGVNAEDSEPITRTFVDISGTPALGNPDAPIVIVEFTDFECPYCERANKMLHELMALYPQKIRIIFKHFPLSFHAHADAAHRAAEAASLMGHFWEMYDLIFEHQNKLEMADIESYAAKIGLDLDRFKALIDSDNVKNRIKADLRQGASVQVSGTPTIFMNGRRLKGAPTIEKWRAIVDQELAIAQKYLDKGTPADALYKTLIAEENKQIPSQAAETSEPAPAPIAIAQGNSYAKGPDNAPVVIYQFSEFQCPFCKKVEPTIAQILDNYGDKVKVVFKNFPLEFHKDASLASEAVLAAGAQGKFWEMHEILFKNQKNLTRPALVEYAKWAGLDIEKFESDLDNHTFAEQLRIEMDEGKKAGISGTPAFVIDGKLLLGAKSFEAFKQEIDPLIAQNAEK